MSHVTVLVNGANGKMGRLTCQTIDNADGFILVGRLTKEDELAHALQQLKPDIVIDFTNAKSAYNNSRVILENKTKAIIGTSGLKEEQIATLSELARQTQTGCIVAPNFSVGAVLMMKYAAMAAKYLPHVEIVETHHAEKLDAPSGTAIKTAQMINQARTYHDLEDVSEELYSGARGANVSGINIHSLRLPGFIASQQVILGNVGEHLIFQHNSISRECFMPGVLLACEKIKALNHLVYGLEHLLV